MNSCPVNESPTKRIVYGCCRCLRPVKRRQIASAENSRRSHVDGRHSCCTALRVNDGGAPSSHEPQKRRPAYAQPLISGLISGLRSRR
eukprot:2387102-Prymnesium_polylepis.1